MIFNKKYKEKYNKLKEEIEKLDDSLYCQIQLYDNRADTKYHRGIKDALISVRRTLTEILRKVGK